MAFPIGVEGETERSGGMCVEVMVGECTVVAVQVKLCLTECS